MEMEYGGDDGAAWRRALRLLLRRFGGRLLLRGRLLNPRELLVLLMARVDATGAPLGAVVRVPEPLALRVGVRGADDTPERVGRGDVVTLARASDGDAAAGVEADVLPASDERAALAWDDAQLLTALDSDTLFGFDVRALLQLGAAGWLADESSAAPNAVLASAPAFSDLRCTRLLLRQSCGVEWLQTHCTLQSFAMAARPLVTSEAHPRSYVSLGATQKRRWADERFEHGKELAAKRRLKDAIVEFTGCLALEQTHAAALVARGEARAALLQFADAVSDFEAARALDGAFAGLDDALLRARGKLRHARRVDLPSSALPEPAPPGAAGVSVSSSAAAKSPVRHAAPKRADDERRQRSRSYSRSGASGEPRKKLETERLRRLLEAEVGGTKEKRERHGRRRERSAGDADASDSDARRRRKRKASKKKKKASKKHTRRRGGNDSDSDSDSGGHSDAPDALRSAGKRRSRKRSRSSSRHHRRRSSSSSSESPDDATASASGGRSERERPEQRSASPAAPHPILARPRHRIWN